MTLIQKERESFSICLHAKSYVAILPTADKGGMLSRHANQVATGSSMIIKMPWRKKGHTKRIQQAARLLIANQYNSFQGSSEGQRTHPGLWSLKWKKCWHCDGNPLSAKWHLKLLMSEVWKLDRTLRNDQPTHARSGECTSPIARPVKALLRAIGKPVGVRTSPTGHPGYPVSSFVLHAQEPK